MRTTLLLTLLTATLLFTSGCSALSKTVLPQVEKYVSENDLNDAATYACVDVWDKQNCPTEMVQKDFGIPYTPLDARVCIGFTDSKSVEDGRKCFVRDFVKRFDTGG